MEQPPAQWSCSAALSAVLTRPSCPQPTNFSNPVYESTYAEGIGSSTSEKANLLPPEKDSSLTVKNGRPRVVFAGAASSDPLHDTDTLT